MGKKRILTYDYLRGLAIILMVVGHCILVYPINLHTILWCDVVYRWIYTFHMPLLFFISGCVYSFGNLQSYLSKKVNRIIVPYIFFGIINGFLLSFGDTLVNHKSNLNVLLRNLLLGYSNWFLYTILLIFITYPLIDKIIKSKRIQILVALAIMALVPSSLFPPTMQLMSYIHYLPFFMLGCCVKSIYLKSWKREHLLALALLCFILHSITFYLTYGLESASLYSMRNLKALLMIACLSCIFIDYEQHAKKDFKVLETSLGFVQKCSIFSLQIYIFNGYWLVVGRTFLCNYCHLSSPLPLIVLLSTFNLAMSYMVCSYILPKSVTLNWLCGNGRPRKKANVQ